MTDWKDDLLTTLLDCGYGDLSLLEDCEYDMDEIIDDCKEVFGDLNINNLVRVMFEFGLRDIEQAVGDRICELEAIDNVRELDEDEELELAALQELSPFDDMESFHNYLDTHIWIEDDEKKSTYTTYLSEALDRFYEMTGFEITY